jgi:biopolymer transport protein ExbD
MAGTQKRRVEPDDPRPKMAPMIDVTFLLLIFFMLTIQFRTLEGALGTHLPKGMGSNAGGEPVDKVRVRIDVLAAGSRIAPHGLGAWSGEGPFAYDADRVTQWSVGPWKTRDADALAHKLRELHQLEPEREVVVDARPGTVYSEAVAALDAARVAGWPAISFTPAR